MRYSQWREEKNIHVACTFASGIHYYALVRIGHICAVCSFRSIRISKLGKNCGKLLAEWSVVRIFMTLGSYSLLNRNVMSESRKSTPIIRTTVRDSVTICDVWNGTNSTYGRAACYFSMYCLCLNLLLWEAPHDEVAKNYDSKTEFISNLRRIILAQVLSQTWTISVRMNKRWKIDGNDRRFEKSENEQIFSSFVTNFLVVVAVSRMQLIELTWLNSSKEILISVANRTKRPFLNTIVNEYRVWEVNICSLVKL